MTLCDLPAWSRLTVEVAVLFLATTALYQARLAEQYRTLLLECVEDNMLLLLRERRREKP